MKNAFLTLAFSLVFGPALLAQTGIDIPSMHQADSLITDFMQTYGIDGGTVAITKDGKLIYNRAFGWADLAQSDSMRPYHLLRIASNSKAITGVAIMKLVEGSQLSLDDTVFGAGRILDDPFYLTSISDNRINNITVRQLLEHTAGWDRGIGCDGYPHCDPIGFPLHVTATLGTPNPVSDSALIKFLIGKGLNHTPGTTYAYSNIGYLVLAKVIEKKTGMSYKDYVSSIIMEPLGLCDMHLGKNLLADKQEREGEYEASGTTLSSYGTGQTVPWQYGGWNLEAMHAHGGWISTSADYVRMILAVDGMATVPDILAAPTVTTMTTGSTVNTGYAKGWSVNSFGNWWHTGSLDGTSAFMARTATGYTWALHFTRRSTSSSFWSDLDDLPWNCIAAVSTFPSHDLFAPATQASGLIATKTSSTSAMLSWTNGSGDKRLVIAAENSQPQVYPLDGSNYTASVSWGGGQSIGSNAYVVYDGTGSGTSVTGLDSTKTYAFTVFEYYQSSNTGGHAVYKLGCNETETLSMGATPVSFLSGSEELQLVPNPAGTFVRLIQQESRQVELTVLDLAGRRLLTKQVQGDGVIDISSLPAGSYLVRIEMNGQTVVRKLIKL